jgi:hypothetical protein
MYVSKLFYNKHLIESFIGISLKNVLACASIFGKIYHDYEKKDDMTVMWELSQEIAPYFSIEIHEEVFVELFGKEACIYEQRKHLYTIENKDIQFNDKIISKHYVKKQLPAHDIYDWKKYQIVD